MTVLKTLLEITLSLKTLFTYGWSKVTVMLLPPSRPFAVDGPLSPQSKAFHLMEEKPIVTVECPFVGRCYEFSQYLRVD